MRASTRGRIVRVGVLSAKFTDSHANAVVGEAEGFDEPAVPYVPPVKEHWLPEEAEDPSKSGKAILAPLGDKQPSASWRSR